VVGGLPNALDGNLHLDPSPSPLSRSVGAPDADRITVDLNGKLSTASPEERCIACVFCANAPPAGTLTPGKAKKYLQPPKRKTRKFFPFSKAAPSANTGAGVAACDAALEAWGL
jgi:hypothetical protein